MHACPGCGKPTEGNYFEEGVRSDLCEECLTEAVTAEQIELELRRNDKD